MAVVEDPQTHKLVQTWVLRCQACDWVLNHKNVMYGHCPRCGRYIQV